MRRVLGAAAAVLVLVTGLSLSTASAAQLGVVADFQKALVTESACAAAMAGSTPVIKTAVGDDRWLGQSSHVKVSSVPGACVGLDLEIFVHDAAGTVIASATDADAAAGTFGVDVGSYAVSSVAAVVARIDGWIFPTQWAAAGAEQAWICEAIDVNGDVLPEHECTVTASAVRTFYYYVIWIFPVASGEAFDFQVSWNTTPSEDVRWRVKFDLAHPHFGQAGTSWVANPAGSTPPIDLSHGYPCSGLPELSFTSRSNDPLGSTTIRISDGPETSDGTNYCLNKN